MKQIDRILLRMMFDSRDQLTRKATISQNRAERLVARALLICLRQEERRARQREEDEEEWRYSRKKGRPFLVETETGEIKGGFGGALNGQHVENAEKESHREKKELASGGESGKLYAEEQITRYLSDPKTLGETTHK